MELSKLNREGLEIEAVDTVKDINLSSNGSILPPKNNNIALIDA